MFFLFYLVGEFVSEYVVYFEFLRKKYKILNILKISQILLLARDHTLRITALTYWFPNMTAH